MKIHPDSKVPGTAKTPEKEIYSRVLHELKMSVESAAGDIIKDNIPNYRAVLQAIRAFKNETNRKPSEKSAGKTDYVANKYLFENKPNMTRVADRLEGTAPFSAG